MSSIKLSPNASGTGEFTIAAPNSNTNRTLTLPDTTAPILAGSGITLSASAPANTLVTDASGNVGIGTSSPSWRVDVLGSSPGYRVRDSGSTNGAVFQQVSGGNTYINVQDNAALILNTNNTERARIDSSGNLLVGRTTGSGRILSKAAGGTGFDTYQGYSDTDSFTFAVSGAGTVYAVNTAIQAISDIRWKENIRDLDSGLTDVMALKPRLYDWKEGKGANSKNVRGFIAQEFEEVFPDLVGDWREPAPEGEDPYKSIRQDLIPTLVKAIQEQQAIIQTLTARIEALEAK